MTPDVYVNLQVLNCTNLQLTTASSHEYQMYLWPGNITLAPNSFGGVYPMAFYAGEGDEDDAGDLFLNLGTNSGTTISGIHIYGGSAPDSGHYITIDLPTPQEGTTGLFALGLVKQNNWPQTVGSASNVSWASFNDTVVPFGPLGLNASPETQQTIAFVDLTQLYPTSQANEVFSSIQNGSLTPAQAEDLWAQVSAYTQIVTPTLTYELVDVVFGDTLPRETNLLSKGTFQATIDVVPGEITATVSNTYENSISLETSSAWTIGAEVGVDTSLFGISVSTSFEAGSNQVTVQGQSQSQSFEVQTSVQVPGTYQVETFLQIDNNYSTTFSGNLTVTGTVGTSAIAINGTVLALLAQNQGWTIPDSDVTLNPSSISAAVTGTVSGSIAFDGTLTVSPVAAA